MKYIKINEFLGKTFSDVQKEENEIIFTSTDGKVYKMYHEQDCCEDVYIESIDGELASLIGHEILMAEETSNSTDKPVEENLDSYTWTYYKLATIKGYVTIRFFGESNGYYCEEADIVELELT